MRITRPKEVPALEETALGGSGGRSPLRKSWEAFRDPRFLTNLPVEKLRGRFLAAEHTTTSAAAHIFNGDLPDHGNIFGGRTKGCMLVTVNPAGEIGHAAFPHSGPCNAQHLVGTAVLRRSDGVLFPGLFRSSFTNLNCLTSANLPVCSNIQRDGKKTHERQMQSTRILQARPELD